MGILVNKRKLSEIVGVSERSLTEWQKEGLPVSEKNKWRGASNFYDTEEVVKWMVARGAGRKSGSDLEGERVRLTKSQADKTELEVEVLRGNLIATEEVELLWSNLVLNFRGRILGIASKLAVQLVGKKTSEIEKILKNAHVEALIELSENVESKPNESKSITTTEAISEQSDAKSTGKAKAAAGNKNKRVGKPKPKTKQRVKRGTRRLEQ